MPSPFPGMDPYLEDPALWPDVHHRLITVASDLLTADLRPKYFVRIDERVYVSDEEDPGRTVIIPDLRIAERDQNAVMPAPNGGGVAVEPVIATTVIRDKVRESYIKVFDRTDRSLVAVIEILSPPNKIKGARGEQNYREKREEILDSATHLIEIDLLRAGRRLVPAYVLPRCDYFVHVSRAERRPKGFLWPIRLQQTLPTIPVPLREGDRDGSLDLLKVLTTAYDRAGYDLRIDYRKEPNPALEAETAAWTNQMLGERKLR